MPFYEYECPRCKYYAEVLQRVSDKPLQKCPSCRKPGFKRLMSAPVFRLKGSGWYETDFKSDKEDKRNLVGAEREEPKAAAPEVKPAGEGATAPAGKTGADQAVPAPAAKADKPGEPSDPRASTSSAKRSARKAKAPARRPAARTLKAAKRGRGRR
jgi:putative FmdB family regulatory protein